MPKDHVNIPQEPVPEGIAIIPSKEAGGIPEEGSKRSKQFKATPASKDAAATGMNQRKEWEGTSAGKARLQTISTILGTKSAPGTVYSAMGLNRQDSSGPKHYDRQLPGMEDPNAAPRPAKWEELSPENRSHTVQRLAEHGTSINQMVDDMGAQVDQAHARMLGRGAARPYAQDFYSNGEEATVVRDSAKALGIPPMIHASMNGLTSPNTKFSQHLKTGEITYPNNETAMHVVRHVQAGGTHEDISNREPGKEKAYQGYEGNIKKAAKVLGQWLQGVPPSNWRGEASKERPEGKNPFGPKTGPYVNALGSDSHPEFTVSDVHTGGGAFFPHLSAAKPTNKTGSEREKAINSIPNFHAAADYATRQAAQSRGLGSTRQTQAAQWGEEQLQRSLRGGPIEDKAYSRVEHFNTGTKKEINGQGSMF